MVSNVWNLANYTDVKMHWKIYPFKARFINSVLVWKYLFFFLLKWSYYLSVCLGQSQSRYSKLVMSATAIVCRPTASLLHLALFFSSNFPIGATKTLGVCRLPRLPCPLAYLPRFHEYTYQDDIIICRPNLERMTSCARQAMRWPCSIQLQWLTAALSSSGQDFHRAPKWREIEGPTKAMKWKEIPNLPHLKASSSQLTSLVWKERQLRRQHKMVVIKTNQRT